MSSSSDAKKKSANDILFKTLLADPGKRAKVLELLMHEGLVERSENVAPKLLQSPLAKLQRSNSGKNKNVRLESPSALARRRALAKLQSSASKDEQQIKLKSPPMVGEPLPFDQLLKGVVAYCEVRSNGQDRSAGIKTMMKAMGAIVCDNLNRGVTHIIFKEGLYSTFRKAQGLKVHLVSVLWLDAVRRHKFRVPESKYRALGVDAYSHDTEARICQEMQKEFDDVIQEEHRRKSDLKDIRSQVPTTSTSADTNFDGETINNPDSDAPSVSESESCASSEGPASLSKQDKNIIPCSQTASQSFTHGKQSHQQPSKIVELENSKEGEETVENIAKYVRDSFELKKAKQIKSPPQDNKIRSSNELSASNKSISTEDDSIHLHVSTTDESNLVSSINKSKSFSNNAQSFLEAENEVKKKNESLNNSKNSTTEKQETKDDSSEKEVNYFMQKDEDEILPTVKPIKTYKGKRSFGKKSLEWKDNLDLIEKDESAIKKTRRRTTICPPKKLFEDTDEENKMEIENKVVSVNKKHRERRATMLIPQKENEDKPSKEADIAVKNPRGGRASISVLEKTSEEVDKNVSVVKKPRGRRITMNIPQTNEEINEEVAVVEKPNRRRTMFVPQKLMFEKTIEDDISEVSTAVAVKTPRRRRSTMSVAVDEINEEIDNEDTEKEVSTAKKPRGRRTTVYVPQTDEEKTIEDNISEESTDVAVKKPRRRFTMSVAVDEINEDTDKEDTEKEVNKNVSAAKNPKGRRTTMYVHQTDEEIDQEEIAVKKLKERRTSMLVQINEAIGKEESAGKGKKARGSTSMSCAQPVPQTDEEIDEEEIAVKKLKERRTRMLVQINEEIGKETRGRRTTMLCAQPVIVEETSEEISEAPSVNEDKNNSADKNLKRRRTMFVPQINEVDKEKCEGKGKKTRGRRTTMLPPQSKIVEETNEKIDEEAVDKGKNDSDVKERRRRTSMLPTQELTSDESDEEMKKTGPKEDNSSLVQKPEEARRPRVRKLFNVHEQELHESLFNWDSEIPEETTTTPSKKVKFYALLPDGFPKTLSYKARTRLISTSKKRSNTIAKISASRIEKPESKPARRSAQHLNFDDDVVVGKPEPNNNKLELDSGIDGIVAIPTTSKAQKKGTISARKRTRKTSFDSTASDVSRPESEVGQNVAIPTTSKVQKKGTISARKRTPKTSFDSSASDVSRPESEVGQNVSKPSRKSLRCTKTVNYADDLNSQGSDDSKTIPTVQRKITAKIMEKSDDESDKSDDTFVSSNSLPTISSVIGKRKSKITKKLLSRDEVDHNKSDDTFVTCKSDELNTNKRHSDEMEGKIKEPPHKKLATPDSDDASNEDVIVKNKGRLKSASTGSDLSTCESTTSESSTPVRKPIRKSPRKARNCSSVFRRPSVVASTPNNRKFLPHTPLTEPLRKTVPQTPTTEPIRRTKRATSASVFKKPSQILKTPKGRTIPLKTAQTESKVTSNRRSTLEFVPRSDKKALEQIGMTQKAEAVEKTVGGIVCTRFDEEDVHLFQQIVNKLRGFTIEPAVSKRTTHLVAAAPARTINLLRAIVRGCWILKKEWLYKSLEEGKWLEEEDYEMTEFSPAVQKCRLEKQSFGPFYCMDIFKDCGTIFVSRNSSPRYTDMEELIQLCGGRIVRIVRDADIIVGELSRNKQKNVACVTEKWVLDSITYNKKKNFKHYIIQATPQL